ncbi:MAG: DnaJ family domain-containing protein [Acidiferrobacterales bacterium]
MRYIDKLAEPRIQEAIGRGEFNNLPGTGKPLALDDDTLVPPELRVAYRVRTNAGYLPRDLQLRSEISDLEAFVATVDDSPSRGRAYRRLNYLRAQLQAARSNRADLRVEHAYYRQLLNRFDI